MNAPPNCWRLFQAWVVFATMSVTLAALFAIPAALESAAGTTDVMGSNTVVRFLVGQIFFSLILACTAFVVALWLHAVLLLQESRFPCVAGWVGFWLAVAGGLLATVGTLGTWGRPVLTAFVPVVVEPVFLSGFALFMAGIAVSTGCFTYAITGAEIGRIPLVPYGMFCTALMMVGTGLAGVASVTRLFGDWFAFQLAWRTPYVLFQAIFWGPAHLIQSAVIGAMVVAWILLLPKPGLSGRAEPAGRMAFQTMVVFAAITLFILYAVNPLELPRMTTLNILISDAQALPAVLLLLLILKVMLREGRSRCDSALVMSILLFVFGIAIAIVGVNQSSTAWVPSHYQAMIPGAVLVAFMGITRRLVPAPAGRPLGQTLARVQPYLYGGGILTVSLAMLWAALTGGEQHGYFLTIRTREPIVLLWIGASAAGLGVLAFAANVLSGLPGAAHSAAV